jgi:hypothetical protein
MRRSGPTRTRTTYARPVSASLFFDFFRYPQSCHMMRLTALLLLYLQTDTTMLIQTSGAPHQTLVFLSPPSWTHKKTPKCNPNPSETRRLAPTSRLQELGTNACLQYSISGTMTAALCGYSATFMRYAMAVTPVNYLLFGCHFVNFGAQTFQGYRYLSYWKYVYTSLAVCLQQNKSMLTRVSLASVVEKRP